MNTVRTVISHAIEEVFEERAGMEDVTSRQLTNRIVKRLTENPATLIRLATESGVLRRIGFTSKVRPKTISPVAITRDHVPAFLTESE